MGARLLRIGRGELNRAAQGDIRGGAQGSVVPGSPRPRESRATFREDAASAARLGGQKVVGTLSEPQLTQPLRTIASPSKTRRAASSNVDDAEALLSDLCETTTQIRRLWRTAGGDDAKLSALAHGRGR